MTTDEALQFLRSHQPMPPTRGISTALLKQLDDVREHFTTNTDNRCVPLLLNAFGEGDGHGIYQMIEDVIVAYPKDVVMPALLDALRNPSGSVRYWSAEIAANYDWPELVRPLADILRFGSLDERIAAVTALEVIGTPEALREMGNALDSDVENEVKELIREVIG